MTRRYLFTLTLLYLLVVAGEALAMEVKLTAIGSETTDLDNRPINYDQCVANIEIKFEVTNNLGSKYLFVMVGSNCEQPRTEENNNCTRVLGHPIENLTTISISVGAKDLQLDCGSSAGDHTVYFLGQESASDEMAESSDWMKLPLEVDTKRPTAPTDVKGGRGETSIPVTWEFGDLDVKEFRVYYEPVSKCPEGSILCDFSSPKCTPTVDGGAGVTEADADDAGVEEQEDPWEALAAVRSETAPASAREIKLENTIAVGQTAAVAVEAIDEAGNRSELSNVACIEGVATVGFCEMNESMGGKCESGCSIGHGPRAQSDRWPAALLVLLAVAWIRLRRRDDASIV